MPRAVGPRALLVYDGDCGFCSASVHWILERNRGRFDAVPSDRLDLATLGLTEAQVRDAAFFEGPDVWQGERAIARSLRYCSAWAIVGRAIDLPLVRTLSKFLYRWVARNGHRLPGGAPACRVGDG